MQPQIDRFCSESLFPQASGILFGAITTLGIAASGALGSNVQENGNAYLDRGYLAALIAEEPDPTSPGWVIERSDNTSLRVWSLVQTRYMASSRKPTFLPSGAEVTIGFDTPRVQLHMEGTIVSSRLNYHLSMDFGDAELARGRGTGPSVAGNTGSARLLDAHAQYNFGGRFDGMYVKAGQFKHVLLTEEAIDSQFQQAIERSLANEFFSGGYTQGLAIGSVQPDYAWEVAVTDGAQYMGFREPDSTGVASPFEADIAVSARFDFKRQGSWDQFTDFNSPQGSQSAVKYGVGLHWQRGMKTNPGSSAPGFLTSSVVDADMAAWTVDYQREGDGWNLYGAYIGQWIDWSFGSAGFLELNNHAFVVQGGYMLDDTTEVFARGEVIWMDSQIPNGFGTPRGHINKFLTVGVTEFLIPDSHAAKAMLDVTYAFDESFAFTVGSTDTIILPDPGTTGLMGLTEHEVLLRMQLQFMF